MCLPKTTEFQKANDSMTDNLTYIDVAVAVPVYCTFTYAVPKTLFPFAAAGKRVLVPFGRRRVTGYILDISGKTDLKEIKLILDVLDDEPLFPSSMIRFFMWFAKYFRPGKQKQAQILYTSCWRSHKMCTPGRFEYLRLYHDFYFKERQESS